MFRLTPQDLGGRILSCGDGPASFNAEAHSLGLEVLSVDPIYGFSPRALRQRIEDVRGTIMNQVRANPGQFVWTQIPSPDALEAIRLQAMNQFLEHFGDAAHRSRYITGSLPGLPLRTGCMDLALCSHFLFLYDQHHSLDFHVRSIQEMVRVAREVRVFPVRALSGERSRHIGPLRESLDKMGTETTLVPVPYEFQRGESLMLVARPR